MSAELNKLIEKIPVIEKLATPELELIKPTPVM